VQSNRTDGASATPLGPVWVYARYPTTKCMSSVDAACECECGEPTHDERRRAIESHGWRLSDAARACVGVRTLPNDQVHVTCRCSMRVRVRRAQVRLQVVRRHLGRLHHRALCVGKGGNARRVRKRRGYIGSGNSQLSATSGPSDTEPSARHMMQCTPHDAVHGT
jgi:hypothetical protein